MKHLLVIFSLVFTSLGAIAQHETSKFKIGDQAPTFSGVDQNGQTYSSEALRTQGEKVLVLFYRGYWCPYCQNHLKELDEQFKSFEKKGIQVLVISPEKPEKMEETSSELENEIPLIYDQGNAIMSAFGVAFELEDSFSKWTLKRVDEYNAVDNRVLPVPATYLIGEDGKIEYVHYDPNYHKRSNLEDLLNSL